MKARTVTTALVSATALAATMTAAPAFAASGDKVRHGSCSSKAVYTLKVGPDNGRLEIEGEVDSNRNGQSWRWRIYHNGSLSFSGTKTTKAPSGSFEVRRLAVNLKGTDTITFRARNPRSGQFCHGTVRY